MKNGPFEDVFPIEHGDIQNQPAMLVYQRVKMGCLEQPGSDQIESLGDFSQ